MHDVKPLIWIEDNNLLHIASISGNCVENIDLREGQKWKIKIEDLFNLFGTKLDIAFQPPSIRIVGN